MLIDAGFPGSRDDVLASLRQLGFGVDDLRAILLTHAHIDHFGSAIWFAKTHGTPVYCHADEVGHAKREYLEQASPVDVATHVWQPRWLKWSVAISRKGAFTRDGIPTAQALTEDVAAGLPGAPMAIPTPGHTGGHCSFVVDGVLVSGDALVTGHPVAAAQRPAAAARRCSTTTRTAACAAWPRWRCSTPRCCCPATARCGADLMPRGGSASHAGSSERLVAQQEDRGQAQPAAQHEGRHQDLVVEIGVVRCSAPTADQRPQHEPGGQTSSRRRQGAATPRSSAKSTHHTPGVCATPRASL